MKKQKIVTIAAAVLIAGTALAETPIGEAVLDTIDTGFEAILDFKEVKGDNEEILPEIISPDEIVLVEETDLIIEEDTLDSESEVPVLAMALSLAGDSEYDIETIRDLAVFEEEYNMDEEAKELLSQWISEGKDARLLMYIYEFWITTNEDISIIEDVYDIFAESYDEDMNLPSNKDLWFEGIFNTLTNNKYGKLTSEEIDEYMNRGLSIDDVKMAERVSRAGKLTVQEILNERVDSKAWSDIAADVYNIPEIGGKTSLEIENIQDILTLTKITNESVASILEKAESASFSELINEHFKESRIKANNKLEACGLIESANEENFAAADESVSETDDVEPEPETDNSEDIIFEIL